MHLKQHVVFLQCIQHRLLFFYRFFGFYSQANVISETVTLRKLPCKDFNYFPGLLMVQSCAASEFVVYFSVYHLRPPLQQSCSWHKHEAMFFLESE